MSASCVGNIANLNNDPNDFVNFIDYTFLANSWMIEQVLSAEDLDRNGLVDSNDLAIFTENWLTEAHSGSAGTYYVDDVNGNDSNPGTRDAPWRTIERALPSSCGADTTVAQGSTVIIRSGNYGSITYDEGVDSGRNDWITYRADSGPVPVIESLQISNTPNAYMRWINIHFREEVASLKPIVRIMAGGGTYNRTSHVQILNCQIDYRQTDQSQACLAIVNADQVNINDCLIQNGLKVVNANQVIITGCWIQQGNDGIYVESSTVLSLSSNVIADGNSLGVFFSPAEPGSENVVIRNNLIYGSYLYSPLWIQLVNDLNLVNNTIVAECIGVNSMGNVVGSDCDSCIIYNNIVQNCTFSSNGANTNQGHNIYTDYNDSSKNNIGSNSIEGVIVDFVDASNYDFRLIPTSIAVDFGNPEYASVIDILGNLRDTFPDAGCYEYVSGPSDTTPPSIPQNLTAQVVSESIIDLTWEPSSDPESGISYYKIYRDGVQIDTSISTFYSNKGLNAGTTYSYEISSTNGQGLESGRSNSAQATTFLDITPPSIVSVSASETSLEIIFNEPLDTVSAEDIYNYIITGGISVMSASLDTDTVTLTTSAHTKGTYTLTVKDVRDTSGNPMIETTTDYEYGDGLVTHWKFDETSDTTA
jgi:hypothetical protein